MTTTIVSNPEPLPPCGIQYTAQAQTQASPSVSTTPPQDTSTTPLPPPPSEDNNPAIQDVGAEQTLRNARLRALSKTFGHIPDVPIFTSWDNRRACSDSAVHRSLMGGICGNKYDGTFSIALSRFYKDNEDGGDIIIYTGAGGRQKWTETSPPKRIRLGPQTEDQSWENTQNNALMVSSHTGNPVRVIRSSKCCSKYAPLTGYRYDGLYKVTTCWTSRGKNSKAICRCRLERLPNQPPIPERPVTIPTSRKNKQRLVSRAVLTPDNSQDLSGEMDVDVQSIPASDDFPMSGLDSDVEQPKPLSLRRATSSNANIDALPRYMWDRKTKKLVRLPPAEDLEVEGEDDATVVPDEDG